jgi:hypothetical protein
MMVENECKIENVFVHVNQGCDQDYWSAYMYIFSTNLLFHIVEIPTFFHLS